MAAVVVVSACPASELPDAGFCAQRVGGLCKMDFNSDCRIDVMDLLHVLGNWGEWMIYVCPDGSTCQSGCHFGDAETLLYLLAEWGKVSRPCWDDPPK